MADGDDDENHQPVDAVYLWLCYGLYPTDPVLHFIESKIFPHCLGIEAVI